LRIGIRQRISLRRRVYRRRRFDHGCRLRRRVGRQFMGFREIDGFDRRRRFGRRRHRRVCLLRRGCGSIACGGVSSVCNIASGGLAADNSDSVDPAATGSI
jgi:hypothetical protein